MIGYHQLIWALVGHCMRQWSSLKQCYSIFSFYFISSFFSYKKLMVPQVLPAPEVLQSAGPWFSKTLSGRLFRAVIEMNESTCSS